MFLALAGLIMATHADLPPAPLQVREATEMWRACVSDGLSRRTNAARADRDVYGMAGTILAECRPQQEAAFTARAQWVEGLELSPAEAADALRRNAHEVRAMHDSIVIRARRTRAYDQAWE
jgi:hypothetical protein